MASMWRQRKKSLKIDARLVSSVRNDQRRRMAEDAEAAGWRNAFAREKACTTGLLNGRFRQEDTVILPAEIGEESVTMRQQGSREIEDFTGKGGAAE